MVPTSSRFALALIALSLTAPIGAQDQAPAKPVTMGEILAASPTSDWHALDPENTLYLDLPGGRVIIELAPTFAPRHVANIKALAREQYFDGLAVMRSQDNFVAQWGDPDASVEGKTPRAIKNAKRTLPGEFSVGYDDSLAFTRLPDADGYAPEVGFVGDFPVGRAPAEKQAWIAHCYGVMGVGRDTATDSGGGTELYVVTGHAPRQLDRNITVAGRVVQGIEHLSTLPRGTGPLGFYEKPEHYVPIKSVRVAADVPEKSRVALEVLRTDSETFARVIEARRNRRDEWYKRPAGYIDLCNVPIPVRPIAAKP